MARSCKSCSLNMRHEDPLADNLLARLFSYSPRKGREPLEDFCTEVLAWCIRAYPELAHGLFEVSPCLRVDTQHRFRPQRSKAGRLDLYLHGPEHSAIVESKRREPPSEMQLQKYRDSHPGVGIWSLATFKLPDKRFAESRTWTEVADTLETSAAELEARKTNADKPGSRGVAFRWFAQFLREKGMAMKFPMFDLRRAAAAADQFEFYEQIFQQLEEMERAGWLKRHLKWKKAGPPSLGTDGQVRYLGVYAKNPHEVAVDWIGFFWDHRPILAAESQAAFGIAAEIEIGKKLALKLGDLEAQIRQVCQPANFYLVSKCSGAKDEQWVTIGYNLPNPGVAQRQIGDDFEEFLRFMGNLKCRLENAASGKIGSGRKAG